MAFLYIILNFLLHSHVFFGLSWNEVDEKNSLQNIYGSLQMIAYTNPERFQSYKDDVICRINGEIKDKKMKPVHLNNFKANVSSGKMSNSLNKISIILIGLGCFYGGRHYDWIKKKLIITNKRIYKKKKISW